MRGEREGDKERWREGDRQTQRGMEGWREEGRQGGWERGGREVEDVEGTVWEGMGAHSWKWGRDRENKSPHTWVFRYFIIGVLSFFCFAFFFTSFCLSNAAMTFTCWAKVTSDTLNFSSRGVLSRRSTESSTESCRSHCGVCIISYTDQEASIRIFMHKNCNETALSLRARVSVATSVPALILPRHTLKQILF